MTADKRRLAAARSGHTGDEAAARALLPDEDAATRAAALGALARMGRVERADIEAGLADIDAVVRRRAAEVSVPVAGVDLVPLLADPDHLVVETICWALGERGGAATAEVVAALAATATGHDDPLCREAAVAALGALGHPAGLAAVLAATTDKPAIRRRAVVALAAFDSPEVDAALQRALTDRDWQVRQAAEDLLA